MSLKRFQVGLSRLALRVFYRLEMAGAAVPSNGPLLLVANHPNSLTDPAAVVLAARRSVRFLAKAPLFSQPVVGPLVRSWGAIPVHRRQDASGPMEHNLHAFRSVHEALREGSAVGIFPEGLSHDEPSLAPLRTGAARIALGATETTSFPIVPVGLNFRQRERFRSAALILVGEPVHWDDLAPADDSDVGAVRELTERIGAALRTVTLNLECWADAPALEIAEAIHWSVRGDRPDAAERLARLQAGNEILVSLRSREPERFDGILRSLESFGALLGSLGLAPGDLDRLPSRSRVSAWSLKRIVSLTIALPILATGLPATWLPAYLTRRLAERSRPTTMQATAKLIIGAGVHVAWIAAVAFVALAAWGPIAALVSAPAWIVLALATVLAREHVQGTFAGARRYLLLASRAGLRRRLRDRRDELALRVDELVTALGDSGA